MQRAALVVAVMFLGVGIVLASGWNNRAHGEDPEPGQDLAPKVAALEMQVAYLLERDATLTDYLLRNEQRGRALELMVQRMRVQGYENKSIPPASRVALTAGLEALARDLQQDLPKVTKTQAAKLRAAKRHR